MMDQAQGPNVCYIRHSKVGGSTRKMIKARVVVQYSEIHIRTPPQNCEAEGIAYKCMIIPHDHALS